MSKPEVATRSPREVAPEVQDLDRGPVRGKLSDHWKTHRLLRLETPTWEKRDGGLPLLGNPGALGSTWEIKFDGVAKRPMNTFAFETRPGSVCKYIGVAVPQNCVPKVYMICFRHSAQGSDYPNGMGLLTMGVGDYLVGRMQMSPQISASGKDVAVLVPIAIGGSGEFESDEAFITQCLNEIEAGLFGIQRTVPLLLVSNSDGLKKMNRFLMSCPTLRYRVKAIYDLDGSHLRENPGISLTGLKGARVFRYDGRSALARNKGESDTQYLTRTMTGHPSRVPLSPSRWVRHNRYGSQYNPELNGDWLHHFIPTCMVQHGLVSTEI